MIIPSRWFSMRFDASRGHGKLVFSAEHPNEALTVRVCNSMIRVGFETVGHLAQYLVRYHGALPGLRNIGQKSFDEIEGFLAGLHDSPGNIPFSPKVAYGPPVTAANGNGLPTSSARSLSTSEKSAAWDEVVALIDRLRAQEVSP